MAAIRAANSHQQHTRSRIVATQLDAALLTIADNGRGPVTIILMPSPIS